MANTLYNPSAGDIYYTAAGVAITSSTQPKVDGGAAANLGADQTLLDDVPHGQGADAAHGFVGSRLYGCHTQRTGVVFWGSEVSASAIATNSGKLKITTGTAHGLSVGNVLIIYGHTPTAGGVSVVNGIARVVSVTDTTNFTVDVDYEAGTGTKYRAANTSYNYATMTAGRYIMCGGGASCDYLAGVAYTGSRGCASDYGIRRNIHKAETFRNHGEATAIRAGYWNIYTGKWDTAPTATNDSIGDVAGSTVTDGTADHEANASRSNQGELVYQIGTPTPTLRDYPAKTG